jgi:hypothetical protein
MSNTLLHRFPRRSALAAALAVAVTALAAGAFAPRRCQRLRGQLHGLEPRQLADGQQLDKRDRQFGASGPHCLGRGVLGIVRDR